MMCKIKSATLASLLLFVIGSSSSYAIEKLRFSGLYQDATTYAPMLNAAKYRYRMEQSRSDQVGSQWLPQISISGSKNKNDSHDLVNDVETEYDGEKYALVARQKLFDLESRKKLKSAKMFAKSRGAQYEDVKDQLVVDLVEAYFTLLESQRTVELLRSEVKALNERFRQVEKMYERKLVKITDMFEVRSRRDFAIAQQIEVEKNLRLAEEYMVEIVGYRVTDIQDLKPDLAFPETQNNAEYWVDLAMNNNDLVRAKSFELQAAEYELSSRKNYLMPTLNLIYSHQRTDLGFENSQSNLREVDYIGLEVNMSLYAGGGNHHRKKESFYKKEMSVQELRLVQTQVSRKVRDAFWSVKLSHAKIEATRQALESYKKTHELMEKSYSFRTVTIADVLDALKERYRAELDYESARYDYVRQYIILKKETGELASTDIQLVDDWLQ